MNCWELLKCGREQGGKNTAEFGVCVAYPDHGKHCAKIAGTLCKGKIQGSFAMKIADCINCDFFKTPYYDRDY